MREKIVAKFDDKTTGIFNYREVLRWKDLNGKI